MKGFNIIRRIAFSSWFLAIFPAALLILFLPPIGSKYILDVENGSKYSGQIKYEDLNGDSISECILARTEKPYNAIVVVNNESQIYDQWNLPDTLIENISDLYFGDYDHNGLKEIYIFSVKEDSVFLNVNEFFKPSGLHINRRFITKIQLVNGTYFSVVFFCGFFDSNGDGKDELYFGFNSGYGREPRRLFCFDLVQQKLTESSFTGNIPFDYQMEDMDGDLRPEIFGNMTAPGNYKSKVPFSDSSTWLMIFDDKLNFKFPPIQFKGYTNGLFVKSFHLNNNKYYILLHTYSGVDSSILKPAVMIYSSRGDLLRSRSLADLGIGHYAFLTVFRNKQKDEIVLVEKKIYILNEKLELKRSIELPFHSSIYAFEADINSDGENDLLLYSDIEEKLIVFNSDFSIKAEKDIKMTINRWQFSHIRYKDHSHKLFLKAGQNYYYMQLKKNKYYLLGFIADPVIYLAFFLFILLVQKITTYQLSQRENLKRRLINLQLQSVKSQLDPHFTFNALNSIAALIYEDNRQSAYDNMNRFTQLLRRMLNDADRIYRSLREELEFVTTYLDLEKLRFGNKFKYEIHVGDGINQNEQVPKMVLQTFAENAIKHGIMSCVEGGILIIKAEKEQDYLKLVVEDNGIGRAKSTGQSTSTGIGLKITNEFYEILNQINKRPIRHSITDLYNETGQAAGTRVEIWVPIDKEFI
jgi:Histidine kinase